MASAQKDNQTIRVAEWMTETVLSVETFDSIAIARQLMAKHRVNQLPVLDNDHLVGIVTDRDIRDAYPTSMMINRGKEIDDFAEKITVEEVMTHDLFIVRPDTPLAGRRTTAAPSDRLTARGQKPPDRRHHHAKRYPRICPKRRPSARVRKKEDAN